jgi:hypothetical protein
MNEIPFNGNLNVDDALRIDRLLNPPQRIWSRSGVVTIAMLFIIGMTLGKALGSSVIAIGITCVLGIFVVLMIPKALEKSSTKAKRKYYTENLQDKYGALASEKIIVNTEEVSSELEWSMFNRLEILEDIAFIAKGQEYLGFAPYMFQSSRDWERCKNLLNEKKKAQPGNQPDW